MSPYAASKIAAEVACFAAHRTRGLNLICVRPFTVFGPRQRPDLAIHKFCQRIEQGEPIELYGDGSTKRDYTYVLDIVAGIASAIEIQPPGFEIVNLGRSNPVTLLEMIEAIEKALGKTATVIKKPMQNGDVPYTYADIDKARGLLNYAPATTFEAGIQEFVNWFRKHELTLSTK
jgi:UDP-glucuronate 4-epimerase